MVSATMSINLRDKEFKKAFLENLPPDKYLKMKNYKYLKDETKYLLLLLKVLDKLDEVGDENVIESDYASTHSPGSHQSQRRRWCSMKKLKSKKTNEKKTKSRSNSRLKDSSLKNKTFKCPSSVKTPKEKPSRGRKKQKRPGSDSHLSRGGEQSYEQSCNSDEESINGKGGVYKTTSAQASLPAEDKCIEVTPDELCKLICSGKKGKKNKKCCGKCCKGANSGTEASATSSKKSKRSAKRRKKKQSESEHHDSDGTCTTEANSQLEGKKKKRWRSKCCRRRSKSREKKKKESYTSLKSECETSMKCKLSVKKDGSAVLKCTQEKEPKPKKEKKKKEKKEKKKKEPKKKEPKKKKSQHCTCSGNQKIRVCISNADAQCYSCKTADTTDSASSLPYHKESRKGYDKDFLSTSSLTQAHTDTESGKNMTSIHFKNDESIYTILGPKPNKPKLERHYMPPPRPREKKLENNEVYAFQTEREPDVHGGKSVEKAKHHQMKGKHLFRKTLKKIKTKFINIENTNEQKKIAADHLFVTSTEFVGAAENIKKRAAPPIPPPKCEPGLLQRLSKSKTETLAPLKKKREYKIFKIAHRNKEKGVNFKKGVPEQVSDHRKRQLHPPDITQMTTLERERFKNQWQQGEKDKLDCFVLQPLSGEQWRSASRKLTKKKISEESSNSFHPREKESDHSWIENNDDEEHFTDNGSENEFVKIQAPFSRCFSESDFLDKQKRCAATDKIHVLYHQDGNSKPNGKMKMSSHCTKDDENLNYSITKSKSFSEFDLSPRMVENGVKQQMISYYPEKSTSSMGITKGTTKLPHEKPLERYLLNDNIISKIRDDAMFFQLTSPYTHIKKKTCFRPDTVQDFIKVVANGDDNLFENVPSEAPSGIISDKLLQMVSESIQSITRGNNDKSRALQRREINPVFSINVLRKKIYNVRSVPYCYYVSVNESTKEEILCSKSTQLLMDNDSTVCEESSCGGSEEEVIASCTIQQIPDLNSETMDSLLLSYQNNATNKSGQLSLKNLENVDPSVQCMLLGRMVLFLLGKDGKSV